MNAIDRIVSYFNPVAGLQRGAARRALSYYEAAKPSKQRKMRRDTQSPQQLVATSAVALRAQARHLERNHDIARGILRTLVNNIVGPSGIGIEPQPRNAKGEIHEAYAAALRESWKNWCITPEVTHVHHWSRLQRLAARVWLRDGEIFGQMLTGNVPYLDHGSRVPFSLELFEPDMVPMDYSPDERTRNGIECNAWGRPVGLHVYRANPLDAGVIPRASDLKRLPYENVLHLAALDRLGQVRGVSEFASVITRLDDIKDYEESERIAAKIAAALTAYVKRGTPDLYNPDDQPKDEQGNVIPRDLHFSPGMVIDSLGAGEEIGLIDSNRPNPNVVTFRQGQLRAVASGIGASYSSISRDYNGTYSAQRQELVEQWIHYAVLADEFVGQFVQPVWERFVIAADLSGVARRPRDVVVGSENDAIYIAQSMPWIDPLKEANAWEKLVQSGFASEVEVLRKRGVNPRDMLEQIDAFRKKSKEKGLVFTSDAANSTMTAAPSDPSNEPPPPEEPNQIASAMAGLAVAVATANGKTSDVHVHAPITVTQPNVTVEPTQVSVSAPNVQVDNHLPQANITVENTVPAAQVVMQHPTRAVQTVERDDAGEISATVTTYDVGQTD